MKKLILLTMMLAMAMLFTACGSSEEATEEKAPQPEFSAEFQSFLDNVDVDFSTEVNENVAAVGDDPVYGFRSAGSAAEQEAAQYIADTMKEIGLQNVSVDKTNVDSWTFKGANVTFTNAEGQEQTIDLGGYQTTIQADNEKTSIMYLDRGTAADYENKDVEGKLILIDINQNEDWWIDKPALQAKLKGAKAVIAHSIYPTENDERVGSQDICGPADAPALAISKNDSKIIQDAIKASGGDELEVTFNADSQVTPGGGSQNVWGEIPGKTDEVIYMMCHMDGYYHAYFDNASGVGLVLGTAKAMVDSGYEPQKTIRFIAHGAEEWGKSNSEADWAMGAYEEITNVHPEWKDTAYGIVNIDGAYCAKGETTFGIAVEEEIAEYIDSVAKPLTEACGYKYRYLIPPSTYKEDFAYMRNGIISVGTAKGEETVYYDKAYHSSADNKEYVGFDDDAWVWMHTLYGRLLYAFDETPVKPINFADRFTAVKESFEEGIIEDEELEAKLDEAIAAAEPVTNKIKKMNENYAAAVADGDTETAESIQAEAIELNKKLRDAYMDVQDTFLHLDGDLAICFPHTVKQNNIQNLQDGIKSLKKGNAQEAMDEYLWAVGGAWYAMYFDKETITTDNDSYEEGIEGTWAEDLVDLDDCDINEIIWSLMEKDGEGGDYDEEIAQLEQKLEEQKDQLNNVLQNEKDGLNTVIETLNALQ